MEVDTKPTLFRKLGVCEVCASQDAKYTCPRCEVRTCSLSCVKIHKKELDCDGQRDRVKFKSVQQLGNLDLQNDYMLLEEMSRNVAVLQKDPLKRYSRRNVQLPVQLFKLQRAATMRETTLQFLPQHFTRHKVNSTYLNWKTQELFWRIEWVFPQADNFTIFNSKVLDTLRIATILEEHLQSEDTKQLLFYQSAGHAGIILLLKAERIPGGKSFYELDPSLSIQENLQGKVIVEFPIIFVILKDHKDMYDVIDPDEEEKIAEKNKHRRQNRKNKGNIQNGENNKTSENTNFLFSTTEENIVKVEPDILAEEADLPTISYEFDY